MLKIIQYKVPFNKGRFCPHVGITKNFAKYLSVMKSQELMKCLNINKKEKLTTINACICIFNYFI